MPKISFNTFGRDPPQEYTWIWGSKSDVYFQMRYRLKLLLSYGPMLMKTKQKKKKKCKQKQKEKTNNNKQIKFKILLTIFEQLW